MTKTRTPVEIQELYDLLPLIDVTPNERHALLKAIDKVNDAGVRRRRILDIIQDALSELRLDMKYLVFDLEATRRERDALKGSK